MKIKDWLNLIRVKDYTKNLFIFLPAVFAREVHQFWENWHLLGTFFSFCALASTVYILNDWKDLEADRLHPKKSKRAMASGKISVPTGVITAIVLGSSSLLLAAWMNLDILALLLLYLIQNLFYSMYLKKIPIVDVTIIALGFVIRTYAGGVAIDVPVSHWLVLMVFLLCIGIALGKRYDDLLLIEKGSDKAIRKLEGEYTMAFIQHTAIMVFGIATVCYILYSINDEVMQRVGSGYFYVTSLPVIVGVLRYFYIMLIIQDSGSPTKIMLKDRFIQGILLLWFGMILFFLYS